MPQSRDNEINSVVEILQSRALLEKVVDALGPATVLARQTAAAGPDEREDAVLRLTGNLKVEAARKSSVIEVSYLGSSPKLCQSVVAKLVDVYLDEHGRINRTHGSHEFFAEQTRRLGQQLSRREVELRDLKSATGLASPAAQRQQIVARVGRLEDELLQTEAARTRGRGQGGRAAAEAGRACPTPKSARKPAGWATRGPTACASSSTPCRSARKRPRPSTPTIIPRCGKSATSSPPRGSCWTRKKRPAGT